MTESAPTSPRNLVPRTRSRHFVRPLRPSRGELDDRQEIQYPAVMRKLLDIKYTGYVGQEFIPTRNAEEGLRQAVRLCDV